MRARMVVCAGLFLASAGAVAATQDRNVPAFDSVHIAAGIHATVELGPQRPVHLEADSKVLDLIETRVEEGTLHVGFKPNTNFWNRHEVTVSIQTPELRAVGGSGGSIVRATFTRSDKSEIHASGGSEMHVRGVDAGELEVHGSGGSILEVNGRADLLDLQMSGGTHFKGRDFTARDVAVEGSGGSEAELRASGKIRGGLSGGSELHVKGGARSRVATSGGSQVHQIDD